MPTDDLDRGGRSIAGLSRRDGEYRPEAQRALLESGDVRLPPGADPQEFVDSHVRRLEALRRAGVVERIRADRWSIPSDFEQRASAYEAQRTRRTNLRVLSAFDPDRQVTSDGATWLDRQILRRDQVGLCRPAYSMISADLVGCSTARNKGSCENRLNIRRDELEGRVLNALRGHLMDPELFAVFCQEFMRRMNERRMEARAQIGAAQEEVKRIDRQLVRLVQQIADGTSGGKAVGERIIEREARQDDLNAGLAASEEPPPVLHPSMAIVYRECVAALYEELQREEARPQAADVIRTLVSSIVLTPAEGVLQVELRGDLAGILTIAAAGAGGKQQNPPRLASGSGAVRGSQVKMVAGTRNQRFLRLAEKRVPRLAA